MSIYQVDEKDLSSNLYTTLSNDTFYCFLGTQRKQRKKEKKTESKISLFIISLIIIIIITGRYEDDEPPFKMNKREKGKARKELESVPVELYRNAIEARKDSGNY